MKQDICDICYYENNFTKAKYRNSRKEGLIKISVDVCENHKKWLAERNQKKIEEIQNDIRELQDNYYNKQSEVKQK